MKTKCTDITSFTYTYNVQIIEPEEFKVSILYFIKYIHSFSIADTCILN